MRIPRRLPERELQTRWFSEPLHYLTLGPTTFQPNKTGNPSLTRYHQDMIFSYMRLKNAPWFLLYDVGPSLAELQAAAEAAEAIQVEFPTIGEAAHSDALAKSLPGMNAHVLYMSHLERQQEPLGALETDTLTSFQDWLQSPLQPLSDNLESATYEMFEGDPVKYNLYEEAMFQAMSEWKQLGKPTSSLKGDNAELVVTVAGAGRGPLVTRALRASERSGMPIQMWAVEKNQNAYVYLLRQNETVWGGRVTVVKTDMRDWTGPRPQGYTGSAPPKVDILVTELLGSFGDNELSPECIDGIQKHIARPHGISIPESYTAWLSPIATPKIHAHLRTIAPTDANAFETPWVVRLYQLDLISQKVPGKPRFQQAWEFVHPVAGSLIEKWEAENGPVSHAPRLRTAGGGAMNNSGGTNEHNARHTHLTFYCRPRGVCHGLAGYFESTLYRPQTGEGKELVELSILPDQIDRKSRDMVSWFPIFFPLKVSMVYNVPCQGYFTVYGLGRVLIRSINSNRSTSRRTQTSRSACGDRLTTPRSGTSGSSRRTSGSAPRRGSRLHPRRCTAAARWHVSCSRAQGTRTRLTFPMRRRETPGGGNAVAVAVAVAACGGNCFRCCCC